MGDPKRGIYHKFEVTRTDGSSGPGGKHEHCSYFVLDVIHDPHARAALKAYAESCRTAYPLLAADLDDIAGSYPFGAALETGACNCWSALGSHADTCPAANRRVE